MRLWRIWNNASALAPGTARRKSGHTFTAEGARLQLEVDGYKASA